MNRKIQLFIPVMLSLLVAFMVHDRSTAVFGALTCALAGLTAGCMYFGGFSAIRRKPFHMLFSTRAALRSGVCCRHTRTRCHVGVRCIPASGAVRRTCNSAVWVEIRCSRYRRRRCRLLVSSLLLETAKAQWRCRCPGGQQVPFFPRHGGRRRSCACLRWRYAPSFCACLC